METNIFTTALQTYVVYNSFWKQFIFAEFHFTLVRKKFVLFLCFYSKSPTNVKNVWKNTPPCKSFFRFWIKKRHVSYPLRIIEGALEWMMISRHTHTQLHLLVKLFHARWRCVLPLRDKHGLQRHLSLQNQSIDNFL